MKIVCENCGAKYSIADEKIKGKVFKIRCKKCSESIVVRGDAQVEQPLAEAPAFAPPPMPENAASGGEEEDGDAPTRVFDYSGYQSGGGAADEAVWHIVVEGEQQGPYTAGQLAEYLTAGNLDYEAFAWREGFDDWKPIREIQDITSKVSGAPAARPLAAAAPAATGGGGGIFDQPATGGGGIFDQPAATGGGGGIFDQPAAGGGGGLFDQPAAGGGGGLFDQPASGGGGGGLFDSADEPAAPGGIFASPGAQQRPSGGGLFDSGDGGGQDLFGGGGGDGIFASTGPAAAPSPRVTQQQAMMTGARNENSVLFSLSNLQALASGGAKAPGASAGGGFSAFGPSTKPAAKGDEASGLIDIRSLAGSVPMDRDAGGPPDDLLSIGGAGFAPALGAPVLTAHREGMGLGVKIGIIAGGVLLAALVVVVLAFVLHEEEPPKETGTNPEIAALMAEIQKLKAGGGSAEDVAKKQQELVDQQAKQAETTAAVAAAGGEPSAEGDDGKKAGKASGGKASGGKASGGKASGEEKPAAGGGDEKPAAATGGGGAAPSKPKGGGVSELDALLGGGSSPKPAKKPEAAPAPAPAAGGGLPDKLTKAQVQAGMKSVANAVRACDTAGTGGSVTVQVTIAPNGRVTDANPTGASAGTPLGLCAARAVRKAKFPETQNSLNVTYPFKL